MDTGCPPCAVQSSTGEACRTSILAVSNTPDKRVTYPSDNRQSVFVNRVPD
ncbi:hypothetical protein Plhal304r1_c006g0023751 [Plasmopara halstedii]